MSGLEVVRVEVERLPTARDPRAERVLRDLLAAGHRAVAGLRVRDVYHLGGELSEGDLARITAELLCDPVVERALVGEALDPLRDGLPFVDVALLPGVTDTRAETLADAARLIGAPGLRRAATGTRYLLEGDLTPDALDAVAATLANPVIERVGVGRMLTPTFDVRPRPPRVERVPVREVDERGLLAISAERRLALDLGEMRAVQAHFRELGREPTDLELEMLAQTWSEHCVHKTFRALIHYEERGLDGAPIPERSRVVDGLLRSCIRRATETLDRPWVHSAFVDNAGIVAFDDALDVAIKVETHNHPSALEPFGGAATGVGGVIRDIMGVSARPIAVLDVLCFGPPDTPPEAVPPGALHPRRVRDGVIHGIEDYGNKMGIPTVAGAVVYHPGYIANPLVYCGSLGVLPRGAHPTEPRPGDLVVVVGGRTGRDGLRGATFSSMEMDAATGEIAGGAVQIGHPIHEKQALEVLLVARDEGLYHAVTDCGAGGLSSAVGEMARDLGADVALERVPLKYAGLSPWEIWLSEAQERMVFAVPPQHWDRLARIADLHGIACDAIGTFRDDGLLRITHEGEEVGALATRFLHEGIPRRELQAIWQPATPAPRPLAAPRVSLVDALLARLSDPNIASKEDILRRYDHEVQGGTVVKPLVGVRGRGPGDGTVLVPFEARDARPRRGVALGVGIDPALGLVDPYAMAWAAVDEAIRNVVAVGADPDRVALLDNFSWGDPKKPDRLGALVRCCEGCHDAAVAYGAPFVSGKDSLNNEWRGPDGESRAIPPTLLVTAMAIVPDVDRTVTSDLKSPGDVLYLLGATGEGLLPPADAPAAFRALHAAIAGGLVRACHDLSEGGLLVAAAEMAIGGELGLTLDLAAVPLVTGEAALPDHDRAFLERPSRFLIEVAPEDAPALEATLAAFPLARVGEVRATPELTLVTGSATESIPVARLIDAFTTSS